MVLRLPNATLRIDRQMVSVILAALVVSDVAKFQINIDVALKRCCSIICLMLPCLTLCQWDFGEQGR